MLTVTCVYRYVWLNEYSGQFLPIIALIALRVVVGVGDFLIKKFGKKKKDRMTEMADEYGKSRATEFNVGSGGSRKDTGVRYADVAGIDTVKADIEETMNMILGDPEFDAIGARPPRVQSAICDPQYACLHAASHMLRPDNMPSTALHQVHHSNSMCICWFCHLSIPQVSVVSTPDNEQVGKSRLPVSKGLNILHLRA